VGAGVLTLIQDSDSDSKLDLSEKRRWGAVPERLPCHVGIIMDGNGRWARSRHLPRLAGHRRGVDRVNEITECATHIGLQALTLFAFSNENWKRPEDEVTGLMGLLRWYLRSERKKILENNIQFSVIGDRRKLSSDIFDQVCGLESASASHTGLKLSIALSYGSRSEISRAAARLAEDVAAGRVFSSDVDETLFESYLDTAQLPALDMVIRTSGEFRISNFLLFQAAYAELFFEPALWPDFTSARFVELLAEFSQRQRRFGKTSEQIDQNQTTELDIRRVSRACHAAGQTASHSAGYRSESILPVAEVN
jgi:undecaprenyl diphosphate synthase